MSQPSMDPKPATVTGELRWWFIDEQYRTLVIAGHIYGDTKKRFADGNYIHTSDVLSGDKETRIIVTKNSSYTLGSAADSSYEDELWARLDLKPATPPADDVEAQIRERDAEHADMLSLIVDDPTKYGIPVRVMQAFNDRHTLLSLLAARDARVAALESTLLRYIFNLETELMGWECECEPEGHICRIELVKLELKAARTLLSQPEVSDG